MIKAVFWFCAGLVVGKGSAWALRMLQKGVRWVVDKWLVPNETKK